LAVWLVAIFLGSQFIQPERPKGDLPGDGRMTDLVAVPATIDSLLRRSCYDCHSDQTRWPWYSRVAPVSWLIVRDVRHGRSDLDFSRWSTDLVREPTPEQRFRGICHDLRRDIMPPRLYLLVHPAARMTDAEVEALCQWADQQVALLNPTGQGQASEPR
jgi:hypothetical protein